MNLLLLSILMTTVGPAGSDAPAREPQIAVSGHTVGLVFGAGNAIYFSRSIDSGKTFALPQQVAEGGILPLTRHRGPRIAFSGSTIVVSAVVGKTASEGPHAHGLPSDGNLLVWRSTDGGKTWTSGTAINDVAGAATEGLHSLSADAKGNLFAAWLDKRDTKTKLYGSRSSDGGRTWSANVLIYASPDGTICECCHPSVAFDSEGTTLVMWRNWLGGLRDMYLARSKDGAPFSRPQKLGEGTWKLNACPMDGGGIAVSGTSVVTTWRREHSLFMDRPGQPEVLIGDGTDVAIAAGNAGVFLIWSTPDGVMVLTPADKQPRAMGAKGAFASIASLPRSGAVAAWEENGKITVQSVK